MSWYEHRLLLSQGSPQPPWPVRIVKVNYTQHCRCRISRRPLCNKDLFGTLTREVEGRRRVCPCVYPLWLKVLKRTFMRSNWRPLRGWDSTILKVPLWRKIDDHPRGFSRNCTASRREGEVHVRDGRRGEEVSGKLVVGLSTWRAILWRRDLPWELQGETLCQLEPPSDRMGCFGGSPAPRGSPVEGGQQGGKRGEVSVLQGAEKETILVLRSCHFTQNKCHRSYKCESFILIDFSVLQKLLPIKDAKQKNTFSRKKVISSIGRTYTGKLVKDSRVSSESIKRFAILENTVEASRNS